MARKVTMTLGAVAAVRVVTGAPVAADSTTLADATFPEATDATTGGAIECRGYSTIWLGVEFVGGTNPTVVIEPLVRDTEAADQSRWKTTLSGGSVVRTSALTGASFEEVRVDGGRIYPRIHAVVGDPTTVRILARPGTPLAGSRLNQGAA